MSEITWIILIIAAWRLIIQPLSKGYRSKSQNKRRVEQEYTDYEEIK